ncbi:MAG: hypothetical protein WC003_16530 [Terrimicrobiaceae bacterium]
MKRKFAFPKTCRGVGNAPLRPSSFILCPSPRGVALIIILAFVVLLTVMVLAYFSYVALQRQISQAGFNQTAVEIFAQGAVNTITGDLRQEIIAGSTNLSTNAAAYQVYFPLSPTNAVPALVGSSGTNGLENLVKRSAVGLAFYPGGTARAAAVSTTNVSQNGRALSPARWNAALLLPKANTNSATDLTPTGAFTPPDWVLVARDGSNPTAWNDNMRWNPTNTTAVVGRYAYAIYDEGGLLDANVAGYPPGSPANATALKGSLATADLTVLPGMTDNAVSALVGWRNFATAQPGGSFPAYTFNSTSQTNYFNSVRTNTSGFLRAANTNLVSGQSDRQFVSRQQLIQFLTQAAAANPTEKAALQNALQYLGTFSRDLEQPSFNPEPNLANPTLAADAKAKRPKNVLSPIAFANPGNGNDAYSSDGKLQDQINPSLLTARSNGQPVMKRRFPLSRLALLATTPPSAADAVKIKDYFGLTWDNTDKYWIYDHGDPARIYKLSEVPADREPDFFETLKAVIHCDSLGKQRCGLSTGTSPHGANGSLIDGQIHNQIIQIGANLIDQYDADSYPTRIQFNPVPAVSWIGEFYGIENLPYLAGWQQMWYRMRALAEGADYDGTITPVSVPPKISGTVYETSVMIQPIIWNPHAPDSNPSPADVPSQFRITAGSPTDTAVPIPFHPQTALAWWLDPISPGGMNPQYTFPATAAYAAANAMTASGGRYVFPNASVDPGVSILTFETGSGDAAFREPFRLRALNDPVGSNASNDPGYPAGRLVVGADPTLVAADGGNSTVIGFYCGKVWTGPSTDQANTQKWLAVGSINRDLKLRLQYKDASGAWRTYDVIENVANTNSQMSTVDNTDTAPFIRCFHAGIRADPRTDRWGLFHIAAFPSLGSPVLIADNGVDAGYGNNKIPHCYLPQGITLKPNLGFTYAMGQSADTAAPGWLNSAPFYASDLMVNLPRTPNANPQSGTKTSGANPLPPGEKYYYTDPDGVFRRGSGWNFSGNDGLPLYTSNFNSRPVILNRPFRSVAEMGYASRGVAWKDIDFFTPESGDSALLDAFCLNELDNAPSDLTVAGRVNLNTRQPKVLEAIIRGVSKADGGVIADDEAARSAQALVDWTSDTTSMTSGVLNKGPLRNRSELVGKFVYQVSYSPGFNLTGGQTPVLDGSKSYQGFSSLLTAQSGGVFSTASDASIKRRCESVLRALVDSGNTRTWNLLIDVAAQVGRYPASATDPSNFTVEGETRFWVHIAIDRFTGEVIAKLAEPVSE